MAKDLMEKGLIAKELMVKAIGPLMVVRRAHPKEVALNVVVLIINRTVLKEEARELMVLKVKGNLAMRPKQD